MARRRNHGRRWTAAQKRAVRVGARLKKTTRSIANQVHRTPAAVRAQASRMRVSLKPRD